MSKNLYSHSASNTAKTWALMLVFFVFIAGIGYYFSYYYGNSAIVMYAIGASVVMNFGSYWFSDKIVLSLSGAKAVTKDEFYELYTMTENLCITAGLPLPKIYVIEDPVPNAFATGRNKNNAAIAFTTGILRILDKNELEGVIAHELSHIGNKDILIQTIVVVLVGFITMLADFFLRMTMFSGGDRNKGDGKIGGIILIIGFALMIVSPIIASLLKLAISRKREFLADSSGALLTRYPEGLASALEKIHAHSGTMKRANHATAHLYISNPFRGKKHGNSFFNKMFLTHPPVEERLAALRGSRSY